MSDPNPTPRPRYGEYASPEQQREHIREPLPTPPPPLAPPMQQAGMVPPNGFQQPYPAGPQAATPGSTADKWITYILLAWGALSVISTSFSIFNFPDIANRTYRMMGIDGSFSNFQSGQLWGAIGAFVMVAGYALTLILALRRLRTGKITWWLPVVGAVVTFILLTVCVSVPFLSDPAFMEAVKSQTR